MRTDEAVSATTRPDPATAGAKPLRARRKAALPSPADKHMDTDYDPPPDSAPAPVCLPPQMPPRVAKKLPGSRSPKV